MISALFYLICQSWKNSVIQRAKRLKKPKYLFGALVGAFYFYGVFFRHLFSGRGNHSQLPLPGAANLDLPIELLGSVVILFFVFLAWFWPKDRAALEFSEAEVAFLFPAPISRKGLIHYKLISSQVGILISSFFLTLISGRFSQFEHGWIRWGGWWILLSTLRLHFLGCSFVQTALLDRGVSTWQRRTGILAIIAALVIPLAWWIHGTFPPMRLEDVGSMHDLLSYIQRAFGSGPLPYLLYPIRLVIRPFLAANISGFVMAAGPALLIMALHYFWVVNANVSFEEASVEAAQKRAELIASIRRGNQFARRKPKAIKKPFFKLGPTGLPAVGLMWKNVLSLSLLFTFRTWLILFVLFCGFSTALIGMGSGLTVMIFVGAMAAFFGAYSFLLGPMVLRHDLRQDLAVADVLKAFPLPGWQIVLGEILAPVSILTLVQWALTLIALVCSRAFPHLTMTWSLRIGLALAIIILAPVVNTVSFLIPNAAVLLLPGWFQPGRGGAQGMEVMGQQLIVLFGQIIVLLFALLPAAIVFALVWFLLHWLGVVAIALPVAAFFTAIALAGEAAAGLYFLGQLFERLDIAAEANP